MRNFTSMLGVDCVFTLSHEIHDLDPAFVRIMDALIISSGSNPSMMSPSEERIIADFLGWVQANRQASEKLTSFAARARLGFITMKEDFTSPRSIQPLFVYHNLNTGHSMAVVWTIGYDNVGYFS